MIDIQVTVAALDHRPPGASGPEDDWRKLFFQPRSGRPANLHVRVAVRPNHRFPLLFRDYLRAHADSAAAYAALNWALAALGIDRGVYADVKAQTGWRVR